MLSAVDTPTPQSAQLWMTNGGANTLLSWGVPLHTEPADWQARLPARPSCRSCAAWRCTTPPAATCSSMPGYAQASLSATIPPRHAVDPRAVPVLHGGIPARLWCTATPPAKQPVRAPQPHRHRHRRGDGRRADLRGAGGRPGRISARTTDAGAASVACNPALELLRQAACSRMTPRSPPAPPAAAAPFPLARPIWPTRSAGWRGTSVLVIGDAMLDRYVYGQVRGSARRPPCRSWP